MPAVVSADKVEEIVRQQLEDEGYALSAARLHGQNGTDIVAKTGDQCLHIEAIASKESPSARAKDFYEAFFRATSRLKDGATLCIVALPARFGMGLPQRAKAAGPAWQRIGKAFPELQIWLIDSEARSIKRTCWSDWAG
jgi:hypothetical protein